MKSQTIRKILPVPLRRFVRRHFATPEFDLNNWEAINPYAEIDQSDVNTAGSPYVLGILKEFSHLHKYYIGACLEMGVPFKVVDLCDNDWINNIKQSDCDIFVVWPPGNLTIWNELYDERLHLLVNELRFPIFPSLKETWIYESKRRTRDWLLINNIPTPQTWIFYDPREAKAFIKTCNLPIVFKTNFGASAKGVRIVRTRKLLEKLVKKAFRQGFLAGRDARDHQWGYIIFQEYLEDVDEWRMIRIGDSFFGYKKERVGDFHSGSGQFSWGAPPEDLLFFLKEVTDKGKFQSMSIDVFVDKNNNLFVNELQTVFGTTSLEAMLRVNDKLGRFILDQDETKWTFEVGDFSRNAFANERIRYLINSDCLRNS